MSRTYNFQVDNGIFVAEYYIEKDYKEITVEDLKENLELFTGKMNEYNKMSTLSSMSHQNSSLTQGKKELREDRIRKQLSLLLDNIGNDKNCMICGKKKVNTSLKIPYSSLMFGLASPDSFINRGNNLRTVDVCPMCLFYSMLSFLNTQKISYPFLYLSDSDDFMRDITEKAQEILSQNIMLDIKQSEIGQNFIPIMAELMDAREGGVYEGLNYITLVQFANAQRNYYQESEISKETIEFLLRIKDRGLIVEFYRLGLFYHIMRGNNLMRQLSKKENSTKDSVSTELYNIVQEETMNKDEIVLVEKLANKLIEIYETKAILRELKSINNQRDFRKLLMKYTSEIDLEISLTEIDTLIKRYREYIDYIGLAIQIKEKEENKNE